MHVTVPPQSPDVDAEGFYPSSDGRPVGETPAHARNLLVLSHDVLERFYADDPNVFVAGNMFVYYSRGDRLKHVSPDVFVVFGVPKDKKRKNYRTWEEGRNPDFVIELTSQSTKEEDIDDKMWLYRHILGVREYFLFDPYEEYLDPRLQGFRLIDGDYVPIDSVDGRLPSEVIGLHLEGHEENLRLYNPATGRWLLTSKEMVTETKSELTETKSELTETKSELTEMKAKLAETSDENQRLHAELAELRRRLGHGGP